MDVYGHFSRYIFYFSGLVICEVIRRILRIENGCYPLEAGPVQKLGEDWQEILVSKAINLIILLAVDRFKFFINCFMWYYVYCIT